MTHLSNTPDLDPAVKPLSDPEIDGPVGVSYVSYLLYARLCAEGKGPQSLMTWVNGIINHPNAPKGPIETIFTQHVATKGAVRISVVWARPKTLTRWHSGFGDRSDPKSPYALDKPVK